MYSVNVEPLPPPKSLFSESCFWRYSPKHTYCNDPGPDLQSVMAANYEKLTNLIHTQHIRSRSVGSGFFVGAELSENR